MISGHQTVNYTITSASCPSLPLISLHDRVVDIHQFLIHIETHTPAHIGSRSVQLNWTWLPCSTNLSNDISDGKISWYLWFGNPYNTRHVLLQAVIPVNFQMPASIYHERHSWYCYGWFCHICCKNNLHVPNDRFVRLESSLSRIEEWGLRKNCQVHAFCILKCEIYVFSKYVSENESFVERLKLKLILQSNRDLHGNVLFSNRKSENSSY